MKLKTDGVPQDVMAAVVKAKCISASTAEAPLDGKPRVFVTAESTVSSHWGFAANRHGGAGGGSGGVDPQVNEVIKTLNKNCPAVDVTTNESLADYKLDMQREPNKGYLQKRNKWILTNHNGDVIDAGSVRSVGSVVKDACTRIAGVGVVPVSSPANK
jgi:hypothetical protein